MGVDLVIHLTDEEVVTVAGWIDTLVPGLSNAQKIELLQTHGRTLLHEDILKRLQEKRAQEDHAAENQRRREEQAALETVNVFDPPTPEQPEEETPDAT